MSKILICDDEKDIVSAINIYLTCEGYETVCCYCAKDAAAYLKEQSDIDLILLDIMMPGTDGITFTTQIRKYSNVPIILLTAKSEDADKVLGLNVGADDYVTKPFVPIELFARIRSQLRRYHTLGGATRDDHILTVGGIRVDTNTKKVTLDGSPITLTKTEFAILEMLMRSPDTVFSPDEIYFRLHGEAPFTAANTVAVHIRHLREKLEIDPNNPRYLTVVWGQGYRLSGKKGISR